MTAQRELPLGVNRNLQADRVGQGSRRSRKVHAAGTCSRGRSHSARPTAGRTRRRKNRRLLGIWLETEVTERRTGASGKPLQDRRETGAAARGMGDGPGSSGSLGLGDDRSFYGDQFRTSLEMLVKYSGW